MNSGTGEIVRRSEQLSTEDIPSLISLICAGAEEPSVLEWDHDTAQVLGDYLEAETKHRYSFNHRIFRLANHWAFRYVRQDTHITRSVEWSNTGSKRARMEAMCTTHGVEPRGTNAELMYHLVHHLASQELLPVPSFSSTDTEDEKEGDLLYVKD